MSGLCMFVCVSVFVCVCERFHVLCVKPVCQRRKWDFMPTCSVRVTDLFLLSVFTYCNKEHFLCHLTPPAPTHPSLFLWSSQVWYLSGWVCYLQLEKSKEQQEREGREVTEEETEERTALKEAARSYLTNAKKVKTQTMLKEVQKYIYIYILHLSQNLIVSF